MTGRREETDVDDESGRSLEAGADGAGAEAESTARAGDQRGDAEGASADAESVVRAYWDRVWLQRDLDALADLVADPVVRHTNEGTQSLTRRELRRRLAGAFEAVRACEVSLDAITADGAMVWLRLTLRGVSLASAAPMSLAWLAQYRVEHGRIAELWALHQVGVDWAR